MHTQSNSGQGVGLSRRAWTRLNTLRTGVGRFGANMLRWGLSMNDSCDCGAEQTADHITSGCCPGLMLSHLPPAWRDHWPHWSGRWDASMAREQCSRHMSGARSKVIRRLSHMERSRLGSLRAWWKDNGGGEDHREGRPQCLCDLCEFNYRDVIGSWEKNLNFYNGVLGVCEPTFSTGGLGGAVSPPAGSGAEPRRQMHFGNNLLKSGLKQVSGSPSTPPKSWCSKRLVFVRSYITKRKVGHSFRTLGYEGPKLVIITHPCPETTGQLPPGCKCLIFHPNK